jgi:hypothetical protein
MWISLSALPIVDLVFAVVYFWSVHQAWSEYTPSTKEIPVDERALGATVIMGQLSSVITGASIIIAGIAAFAALGQDAQSFPQKYHLFYAATWAVLGLSIALYTTGTLPTRAPNQNFVTSKGIAYLCSASLFFSLLAGVRLLFGIASMLKVL